MIGCAISHKLPLSMIILNASYEVHFVLSWMLFYAYQNKGDMYLHGMAVCEQGADYRRKWLV